MHLRRTFGLEYQMTKGDGECLLWVTSRATGCVGLGHRPVSGDHSSRWKESGKEAATAGS